MSQRIRLDRELVRRSLARSREHATQLIDDGRVFVAGQRAGKPTTQVGTDQPIVVKEAAGPEWVSRGAHKLLGALAEFEPLGLDVSGRRALDAGASTGGFTQVLLERGVARVLAVDVGYGQLAWRLQTDDRVEVMDRTNVRTITPQDIGAPVSLIVSDLSFISLTIVLPAMVEVIEPDGDIVVMIKPQFEVGKENLGKNGVVRDPGLHADAVHQVCSRAWELGWGTRALAASPLPGPAGNVEYFCWLRADAPEPSPDAAAAVVAVGPLDSGQKGADQ